MIGGGEPTIYPYFEEVVKFLKNLSLQAGIVSNGSLIEKIKNICNLLNQRDWIRFSLDAGTNESFQKIHRPRLNITLERILQNVKEMHKTNPVLQIGFSFLIIGDNKYVNSIPLINNIKEISLAAKAAKENGFSYLSLKPFICPEGERVTEMSDKNLQEIKKQIREAKKFEDEYFKVIESVNLLALFDKDLYSTMQNQAKVCHAQFFRSVVIPGGIFQCSLWRGFDNAKIIDTNQKITGGYYQKFHQNRIAMIDNFNAKKICRQTLCLYAPLNEWIEDLIIHPDKLKKLKPIDDFNDYFL